MKSVKSRYPWMEGRGGWMPTKDLSNYGWQPADAGRFGGFAGPFMKCPKRRPKEP